MSVARFSELVSRQPENEMFRFSLAQALLKEARDAEAVPHLEACLAQKPDWMMARIHLGKALLRLGQRDEAKAQLKAALQLAIEQQHEDPERELRAVLSGL